MVVLDRHRVKARLRRGFGRWEKQRPHQEEQRQAKAAGGFARANLAKDQAMAEVTTKTLPPSTCQRILAFADRVMRGT